jgi:hypothetical protein
MPSADSYDRAAANKKAAAAAAASKSEDIRFANLKSQTKSATSPDAEERRFAALKKAADERAAAAKAAQIAADKAEALRLARLKALAAKNAKQSTTTTTTGNNTATSSGTGESGGDATPQDLYEPVSTTSTTATAASTTTPDVKIATSNLFIFEDIALTAETMTDLVFEDIGGRELIDIVSGDMVYDLATSAAPNQPIKNLSSIVERYSPRNLINLQGTSDKFFQSNFQIDINSYIPLGSDVMDNPHVYIVTPQTSTDTVNEQLLDHLVIEVINVDVANNERVEVEILSYEDLYDDTIY